VQGLIKLLKCASKDIYNVTVMIIVICLFRLIFMDISWILLLCLSLFPVVFVYVSHLLFVTMDIHIMNILYMNHLYHLKKVKCY